MLDRIEARVEKITESGCWIWLGCIDGDGYGRIKVNGRSERVHRVSVARKFPRLRTEDVVLHLCDVRSCCNPAHLKVGTQRENVRDAIAKGRHHAIHRTETAR